jgi:hypothetical protein
MKVFLTRYALTKGIQVADAEYIDSGYWSVSGHYTLYSKGDCHTEKESAIAKAEEMRIAKLQSLDKQIKKYSRMIFDA